MRLLITMVVTAVAVGLCASHLQASPIGAPRGQNAVGFTQPVQGFPEDLFGGFCPAGQFYSCWVEPYGRRFCGCWWNGDRPACPSGYHFTCRIAPDRRYTCGCY